MSRFFNNIITIAVCACIFFTMFTPMRVLVKVSQPISYLIPVVLIFIFDKLFLRKEAIASIIVVLIIIFLHYLGVGYFEHYIADCMTILFGVFAFEHYFITRDKRYATWVLTTEFVTLFVLIVMSIPQFMASPNLTRMIFKAGEDTTIDFEYYWCISYRTVHELPVLSIPVFTLFHMAQKKLIKVLSLICLVLMAVVMFYASSTTSLILLAAVYFIMFSYNKRATIRHNIVKMSLIIMFVLPFLSETVIVGIIDNVLLPVVEGSSISNKVYDFRTYILTGESENTTLDGRVNFHSISIESIMSNPLFPEYDDKKIGQHSYLLDYLAAMGLILFIPFCMCIYYRYKRPLRYIPHMKFYHIVGTFFFLFLAFFKHFFIFIPAMFIVPLFLIQMENKKINKL